MHIQTSKSSRTAHCGRLFIITLLLLFIGMVKANAASLPWGNAGHKILLLQVNIQQASLWAGFANLLHLGMQYFKNSTHHLLFLFTLLLPAMLVVSRKKQWGGFGGVGYSLVRILKIVIAFTIGHSITLLIGSTGLIHFPGRAIEVLIALSILLSSIHACRPIFPGKETYIAAGFGLIHGIAFAEMLVNLNPDTGHMALAILGFNLGIQLMQLLIIVLIIPWLIILSQNKFYVSIRITGAFIAATAAIGLLTEQVTNRPNIIGTVVISAASYGQWLILILAIAAGISYFVRNKKPILLV